MRSVERIKNRSCNSTFSFRKTNSSEIYNMIDNMNLKKTCQNSDIPSKIIKPTKDNIVPFLSENPQVLY